MEPRDRNRYKSPLLIVGVLFVLIGLWGAADIRNEPYLGMSTDPSETITEVRVGSPADRAGMKVGDVVKRIDGVEVSNTRALLRLRVTKIGQTRTYVVERAGESLTLSTTLEVPTLRYVVLSLASALIGWCFLVCGLWAFIARPARDTLLLALAGLALGFGPLPRADAPALRLLLGLLTTASGFAGVSLLLHFALVFPRSKALVASRRARIWLYVPAAVAVLYLALLMLVRPDMTRGVSRLTAVLMPAMFFLYLAGGLLAFIHSYVTATKAERVSCGLNLVVIAAVIGFAPAIVSLLVYIVAPRVVLPGADYYMLTIVLLPIALSWATVKAKTPAVVAAV